MQMFVNFFWGLSSSSMRRLSVSSYLLIFKTGSWDSSGVHAFAPGGPPCFGAWTLQLQMGAAATPSFTAI